MAHDVFISYSNQDKAVADAACAKLESRKIRCWIAPRDVPAGQPWASALVSAINTSRVMVLILSERSNNSQQVIREVDEAVSNGIPILPLRIDEVEPSDQMRYYIKSIHWLDALTPPLERHLEHLADSAQALLSVGEREEPLTDIPRMEEPTPARRVPTTWAIAVLILIAVLIIGGVGSWLISQGVSQTERPSTVESAAFKDTPRSNELAQDPLDQTEQLDNPEGWRPVSFIIPNPQLWEHSGENQYIAIEQHDVDAFAWSTEMFDGDLEVSLELKSAVESVDLSRSEKENQIPSPNSGCVILYSEGQENSPGSLIFCIDWDGYYLYEDSRYQGEPLVFISHDNHSNEVYRVNIAVKDGIASLIVNGENVLSAILEPNKNNYSGRIGLFRNWAEGEITFSNIQVKFSTDGSNPSIEENIAINGWGEWQTLSFDVSKDPLWRQSGENSYTPIEQSEVTAFLWSNETVEGDLILSYEITSSDDRGDGGVVIYGDGKGYTQGSLFFIAAWDDWYYIGKNTPHEEVNYLANHNYPAVPTSKRTFDILIEIIGDQASLSVDGHKFPPVVITEDVVQQGRIGFTKYWEMPAVTYSNIKIKTRTKVE